MVPRDLGLGDDEEDGIDPLGVREALARVVQLDDRPRQWHEHAVPLAHLP